MYQNRTTKGATARATSVKVPFLHQSNLGAILDGFDGQLIGFAIPVIIRDWGATRADFAPVVAAGLVGMGIGSAIAGVVGDRRGRRLAIIGSVATFGVGTALIGLAPNLETIGALRFVAGLGIGGALPSAATVAAELSPRRIRTMAITATIICVPLGGMLAGFFAATVLPHLGWRALFALGGALPLTLAVVLFAFLPESPRWLAARPGRATELVALLRRMARDVPLGATFIDSAEMGGDKEGVGSLFLQARGPTTLLLWISFFLCLLAVYAAFSWLPTMLVGEGLSVAQAGRGLTAYNMGGVLGALMCALAVGRFGSRWPMVASCFGGALSALLLSRLQLAQRFDLALFGIGLHGLFVNAVQAILYAVTAYVYPTSSRATGTAMALTIGRLGAIVSAFLGAVVLAAGGSRGYLLSLFAAMSGAMVALAILPRHIPPASVNNHKVSGS